MYDQIDSPPVPVAVGSPVWARKSFDTKTTRSQLAVEHLLRRLTIEECIEVVIIYFAEFEEVLAHPRA